MAITLRCGAIAAHSPIMREVRDRAAKGTPIPRHLQRFQILTEAGLLPGTLLPNRSLRFTCRDVHLRVENNQTIFTCGYEAGQTIRVPVAHHDGNYTADPETLDRLEDARSRRLPLLRTERREPEGKLQRFGTRDRRHLQRRAHRPRPDAAPRTPATPCSAALDGGVFDGLVSARTVMPYLTTLSSPPPAGREGSRHPLYRGAARPHPTLSPRPAGERGLC